METLVEPRIGHASPRPLPVTATLRVRYLAGAGIILVEARNERGEFLDANAFETADLKPVTLYAQVLRRWAGPSPIVWYVAWMSPFAAVAAWLLARRRIDGPRPACSLDGWHAGAGTVTLPEQVGTLAPLSEESLAALRALPVGAVVLELDAPHEQHYRDRLERIVRRALPGTLAEWERERILAPLLPWLAASVAGFCSLCSLAGW